MYRSWLYCAALLHLFLSAPAASQTFPAKPVRIVAPSAPGGGPDVAARALAQQLGVGWKAQVVVDNRPSAAGNIAAEVVAKAPPDGYTLLLATNVLAINPAITPKLTYQSAKDFIPVGALMSAPYVLLVHPSLQVKTVKDLLAMAKAQPQKLRYGHPGGGSAEHVCAELFGKAAGVQAVGLGYKGAVQASISVLAPEIEYAFSGVVHALPHMKAGQARALAITTPTRYALLPTLPTVQETLPGFEFGGWQALFAPARTPPAVLRQIELAVFKAMGSKEVTDTLTAQGLQPVSVTPEELRTFLPQQVARWAALVREANIKIN